MSYSGNPPPYAPSEGQPQADPMMMQQQPMMTQQQQPMMMQQQPMMGGGQPQPVMMVGANGQPVMMQQQMMMQPMMMQQQMDVGQQKAQLQARADQLFDAKDFKGAQPLWDELAKIAPGEMKVNMRAGCSYTFATPWDEQSLQRGEQYLLKATQIHPEMAAPWSVLARNRLRQNRFADAMTALEQMLKCPPKPDADKPVMDGMRCGKDCLQRLMRPQNEWVNMVATCRSKYPELSQQLNQEFPEAAGGCCVIL